MSVGFVVTELVINILKYGFSRVEANGAGMPDPLAKVEPEPGTGIVEALAGQLDAVIDVSGGKLRYAHYSDAHPKRRLSHLPSCLTCAFGDYSDPE